MNNNENTTSYPDSEIETGHAEQDIVRLFEKLYLTKNSGYPGVFASEFSKDMLTYTDAALGWEVPNHAAFKAALEQYMPKWIGGRAYLTRIVGGPTSAIVAFTDTPELFGDDIHGLGAVDISEGKVIRWIDYWDSTTFNRTIFDKMASPDDKYPVDFHSEAVASNAVGVIYDVVRELHSALISGHGDSVASLFSFSARFEDAALRTLITGRNAIARYVGRLQGEAPYGEGSDVSHVLGGPTGGGYEWTARPSSNVRRGITALELDRHGQISRLTTLYDARRLPSDIRRHLILCGQEF